MIQIILTGKDKDMAKAWLSELTNRAIGRKLDTVIVELRALTAELEKQRNENMATKQEVKADLDAILVQVTATKGAADSALELLNRVLGQISNAAATATDLDAFRTDLALIMAGTKAAGDELKAAVDANPGT